MYTYIYIYVMYYITLYHRLREGLREGLRAELRAEQGRGPTEEALYHTIYMGIYQSSSIYIYICYPHGVSLSTYLLSSV